MANPAPVTYEIRLKDRMTKTLKKMSDALKIKYKPEEVTILNFLHAFCFLERSGLAAPDKTNSVAKAGSVYDFEALKAAAVELWPEERLKAYDLKNFTWMKLPTEKVSENPLWPGTAVKPPPPLRHGQSSRPAGDRFSPAGST